jgi:Fe2+ or Zn2+ uptake regulation protein
MDQGDLITRIRQLGIRVTAQRLAVAGGLGELGDHPTAQEVYERVREHLPHLAFGDDL